MAAADLRLFEGAVAVVTGGASGIGRALSEELARRGASVVLADLQSEEAAAGTEADTKVMREKAMKQMAESEGG